MKTTQSNSQPSNSTDTVQPSRLRWRSLAGRHMTYIGIALIGLCYNSLCQALSVVDGDFAHWNVFHFNTDDPLVSGSGPNTSTGSGQRSAIGGNPGAHLQFSHTFTTGDVSWIGAIKTDNVYRAASQAAISSLAVSADVMTTSSAGGESYWQLVVQQNGKRYYSFPPKRFPVNAAWTQVTNNNLTAADFDTNPQAGDEGVAPDGNQPNFGVNGAPIEFGFMFGNYVNGNGTLTTAFGLDNFSVSINPESELVADSFVGTVIQSGTVRNQTTTVTYPITKRALLNLFGHSNVRLKDAFYAYDSTNNAIVLRNQNATVVYGTILKFSSNSAVAWEDSLHQGVFSSDPVTMLNGQLNGTEYHFENSSVQVGKFIVSGIQDNVPTIISGSFRIKY